MASENFSMIVTMTNPYSCLENWDDIAFALGNQFKPNRLD